jgi:hypothetical protein
MRLGDQCRRGLVEPDVAVLPNPHETHVETAGAF